MRDYGITGRLSETFNLQVPQSLAFDRHLKNAQGRQTLPDGAKDWLNKTISLMEGLIDGIVQRIDEAMPRLLSQSEKELFGDIKSNSQDAKKKLEEARVDLNGIIKSKTAGAAIHDKILDAGLMLHDASLMCEEYFDNCLKRGLCSNLLNSVKSTLNALIGTNNEEPVKDKNGNPLENQTIFYIKGAIGSLLDSVELDLRRIDKFKG